MHSGSRHLIKNGTLDLSALADMAARPPLDAPHESRFWNDPYISQQMLTYHLDPTTDAASARPEKIDRTVDWLISYLRLQPEQRVVDLGCGPGLYCSRLCQRGLEVTGVDFSANSIEYARRYAQEEGLRIEYVCRDYVSLDYHEQFDAASLIYEDFGVLPPDHRDELLARVHRALVPGGAFAFDVVTPERPYPADGHSVWAVGNSRFWKPGPYLELTRHYEYEEGRAHLEQVIIVEESGEVSLYRIWEHRFTPESIAALLEAHGFAVQGIFADLIGSPYTPGSVGMGVVARKR
ncbi:MAG: SAM-dependent methyltransferase [Anaerolineae bacterium]